MVFTNSPRTVMVWTVAYRTCPAPVRACMHACAQLSFMPLSRVPPRRCTPRTPRAHTGTQREGAAITAHVGGGRRGGPRTHQPPRTGVNYVSREMSNCSPYRKIYNSSRCGKHYVPSPTLRIPIRPDPFPHGSPIRPLPRAPPLSHPLFQAEGRSTIRWTSSQIAGGGSQALSLSLSFRSIPNYFRGGGRGAKSLLRVSFKSCFCFRPFPFYSWVVDIKAYTEGLIVERGLKFRSRVSRDIGRVYTRAYTQGERNNRGCGSGTRSDLAIFPPRPVSNRQSGSALVH